MPTQLPAGLKVEASQSMRSEGFIRQSAACEAAVLLQHPALRCIEIGGLSNTRLRDGDSLKDCPSRLLSSHTQFSESAKVGLQRLFLSNVDVGGRWGVGEDVVRNSFSE